MTLTCQVVPALAIAALLLPLLLVQRAVAQDAIDPALAEVLRKIEAAQGQPTDKPRSLAIEGTYSIVFQGAHGEQPAAEGRFREYFVGNDLARHTSDMGEFGALERGIHRDLVWEVDPAMGAKVHRGANAAAARRFNGLLIAQSPRDVDATFELAGTERVDGCECTVLRVTPKQGKPDRWFVDAEGHVVRADIALPAPESADATFGMDDAIPARITFADWRPVGGAKLPFKRTLVMGPAKVSFVCAEIKADAKIDPAKFTPPDAVAKADRTPKQPAFDAEGKPTYQIEEKEAQPVASIRVKCKPEEISSQLAILLPEVMTHLNASGAKMAGAPFSRYHAWSEGEIDLEAGIPVQKPVVEKGRVKNSELPGGRAVTCWHVGPYHDLDKAHEALRGYLERMKLATRGGPWEVYWTDPGMVPDPAKWRTQLFAPVE
jgi:AraC family transcriptional regulator